jgi:hypothetical protein
MTPSNQLSYAVLRLFHIIAGAILAIIATMFAYGITHSGIVSVIVYFAVFIHVGGRRISKE